MPATTWRSACRAATSRRRRLGVGPRRGSGASGSRTERARWPRELSGGQAQRVALGRAVVSDPRLLLLDEPLAALDAGARLEIRRELRDRLAEASGARVLVTHDPVDAASIADRVVILEAGRVVQQGSMDEITMHPRSAYVADLVGLNLFRGMASSGAVQLANGAHIVVADSGIVGDVAVAVHPRAVALHLEAPHGSPRNTWPGHVRAIDRLGDRVRVMVDGPVPLVAEVTPAAVSELQLSIGREVFAVVKASEIEAYLT